MTDASRRVEPPPRRVSVGVACALVLGGGSNQTGWSLVGFGVILSMAILPLIDFGFASYGASARGVIERVEETDAAVNDVPVLAFSYRFTAPDGQSVTGVSYSRRDDLSAGQAVAIELDPDEPTTSRIEGMRRRPFGRVPIFVLAFPLMGVFLVGPGVWRGLRAVSLVRRGRLAKATLVESSFLDASDETDERLYRLTFEHEVDGALHRFSMKTSKDELIAVDVGRERWILYAPSAPGRAMPVEELAGCRVANGALVATSRRRDLLFVLLPAAALAAVVSLFV